jgi:hypothetical protein
MHGLQLETQDNRKFTWFKYIKLQIVSLRGIKVFELKFHILTSKMIVKILQKMSALFDKGNKKKEESLFNLF